MNRFYILISMVILCIFEVIITILELLKIRNYEEEVNEFMNKFVSYYSSKGTNQEVYAWIIQNSAKIQKRLGHWGVLEYYISPGNRIRYNNYEVIMNEIPAIARSFRFSRSFSPQEEAHLVEECILRYVGELNEERGDLIKKLKNPFRLLRKAVERILIIPFSLLYWLSIINLSILNFFRKNYLIKVISGLATFLTIVTGIMSLTMGWDDFLIFMSDKVSKISWTKFLK